MAEDGQTFAGSVELQGRPNPPEPSWVTPLMLTMHEPGSVSALASYAITSSTSGQFTIGSVPTGTSILN